VSPGKLPQFGEHLRPAAGVAIVMHGALALHAGDFIL
jgi:hypothetical protein